mmetsp:Transcript_68131/g.193036  ORF Transcript_68131/g.193036 Transcript_68131/m.193036 type:complete len:259 (+) Transcript_68131:83-859(+)
MRDCPPSEKGCNAQDVKAILAEVVSARGHPVHQLHELRPPAPSVDPLELHQRRPQALEGGEVPDDVEVQALGVHEEHVQGLGRQPCLAQQVRGREAADGHALHAPGERLLEGALEDTAFPNSSQCGRPIEAAEMSDLPRDHAHVQLVDGPQRNHLELHALGAVPAHCGVDERHLALVDAPAGKPLLQRLQHKGDRLHKDHAPGCRILDHVLVLLNVHGHVICADGEDRGRGAPPPPRLDELLRDGGPLEVQRHVGRHP